MKTAKTSELKVSKGISRTVYYIKKALGEYTPSRYSRKKMSLSFGYIAMFCSIPTKYKAEHSWMRPNRFGIAA